MKIRTVRLYQHDLPILGGPYVMSSGPIEALDTTLVEIETEDGVTGWGETCPLGPVYAPAFAEGARAALRHLAPYVLGAAVDDPADLHRRMDDALMGHAYAKAALDIALFDAWGKTTGQSVASLLGGAKMDRVPSYYALNVAAPEETARVAVEKLGQGFRRLQIKVGGRAVETDIETVRRVAEAVGPGVKLVADANRGLSVDATVALSEGLRDVRLTIEQPCDGLHSFSALKGRLHHPLFMDESSEDLGIVERSIAAELVDGFGLKVTRLGGFFPMTKVRDLCAAHGIPHTVDDSWGGDIITAACVQLGATVDPARLEGVWTAQPYIERAYDKENGPRLEQGTIAVSERPGLGLEIEPGLFGKPVAVFA
ncbi:MAG: mandelate racemase/muconate lactonizing enzyme family protein [Alphaproteobacteria bacterium]